MAIELITGHAGSAHISSEDAGWFNAGVVGDGKYVLDTGTQFACNVQSANAVTIGTGDALFEGRHVRVSSTETVALDNGAQGMNRNDLICIKYEYASGTGVESASLAVLKGTATSGTATDPDVPSGSILQGAVTAYMPLWRIPISGITVGTPVKLYGDALLPLDSAFNRTWSVSQIPNLPASKTTSGTFDAERIPDLDASKITGSVSLSIADGVTLQALGKVCVLHVSKSCALTSAYASVQIGTIPSSYRPISNARSVVVVQDTTGKTAELIVNTSGAIGVYATGGEALGTHYVHGSLAWICA